MNRTRRIRRELLVTAVSLFLAISAGACGADSDSSGTVVGEGPSRRNSADVAFASKMVPHHAQAIAMVNLTLGRSVDPTLATTAEEMLMDQAGETSKMSTLLQDWGKPVPRTMIDHVGHTMGDTSMPGALTRAEFHRLEKSQGEAFEQAWLKAMIAHHEGAIRMARTEQAAGVNPAAKRIAAKIINAQQAELQELRHLLRTT